VNEIVRQDFAMKLS